MILRKFGNINEIFFDSVQLMYYKCRKAHFRRVDLHIDTQDWIKKGKKNNKSEKNR